MAQAKMKSDSQIQADVFTELRWDHRVDEAGVGVDVHNGIVTLSGTVSSYRARAAAQETAHRVWGVFDVVNHIDVRLPGNRIQTDEDIAAAVRLALNAGPRLPAERIRTTEWQGAVILEGEVDTARQRSDAELAVRAVCGVREIVNRLAVRGCPRTRV